MTTTKNGQTIKISCKKLSAPKKESLLLAATSVVVLAIIIMLATNPKTYSQCTLQGLSLFATCVMPGLLPFMFFTKMLTGLGAVKKISCKFGKATNFLFGTSGISGYVMLMSMLSGYPIGAKLIADLYSTNNITKTEAKAMVSFCTTSGPIFVVGSVGSLMFGCPKIGWIIYLAHILGGIMSGIILAQSRKISAFLKNRKKSKHGLHGNYLFTQSGNESSMQTQILNGKLSAKTENVGGNILANASPATTSKDNNVSPKIDAVVASSMADTVQSILIVGGYISIFFLLAQMLMDIGLLSMLSNLADKIFALFGINGVGGGFVGGLLEVTRGCKLLSSSASIGSVCLACWVISFSGMSIIMQSMNFLHKVNIKLGYFVAIKLFNALLSTLLCLPLYLWLM